MRKNERVGDRSGLYLPLIEDFYTIQGEGFHSGKPAYFIRLGGCDIGCAWCDSKFSWNPEIHKQAFIYDLIERIKAYPVKSLVVTGGEPLLYNLNKLCNSLKMERYTLFLETSGAHRLSGIWDWICLSPKKEKNPLPTIYEKVHELKVIIRSKQDFEWAEENADRVNRQCYLYLQPEWSNYEKIIPLIVDYVKANPKWNVSLQIHKFMHIP
jgi:organic radical activating enzyme